MDISYVSEISDTSIKRRSIIRPKSQDSLQHPREMFILPKLQSAISYQIELWGSQFPPGSKVLDMGCGQQPYRELLIQKRFSYVGFDVIQNDENKVDFLGKIDDLQLPDMLIKNGPYDMILATEVFEHVLDWGQAFRNLSRLLGPEGEILITCPFLFPIHETPFDFWRPTPFALAGLSDSQGFEVKSNQTLGSTTDCLGLILGHLIVGMKYQTTTSFWRRINVSIQQRVLKTLLKGLHSLVKAGWLEANFSSLNDMYVSNVTVLTHKKVGSPDVLNKHTFGG